MTLKRNLNFYSKILICLLILFGLFGANLAMAGFITGPIVPCGRQGQPNCDLCHLWNLGSNLINFISFNLAVPAAVLLFVASGVILLTSAGSDERVKLAKSIFTNTIFGIVIIFCSWLLVDSLIKTIAVDFDTVIASWSVFPVCP